MPTVSKNPEQFLSKIEVSSFKGLHGTSLHDIGQINLILGDNNVGKTSLLESLMVDENPYKLLSNLRGAYYNKLSRRRTLGNIDFVTPFIDFTHNNDEIKIKAQFTNSSRSKDFFISSREIGALSKSQQEKLDINSAKTPYTALLKIGGTSYVISQESPSLFTDDLTYMPFIASKDLYADDLLEFYSKAILPSKSKKQEFIRNMRLFIPELEDIEISTQTNAKIPVLVTRLNNIDSALPFNMYGDGSIKFFRILVEIAVCENSRLMIDEIDSGIHYSRLETLWRTTLNSAEQNNTQLFITTHNEECLLFLKNVLEEEEFQHMQSKCKCYTLKQLPDSSTKAYIHEFQDFAFAIEQNVELRGGRAQKVRKSIKE